MEVTADRLLKTDAMVAITPRSPIAARPRWRTRSARVVSRCVASDDRRIAAIMMSAAVSP